MESILTRSAAEPERDTPRTGRAGGCCYILRMLLESPPADDAARARAHGLALLRAGRCRRCAELLTGGTALRGLPCGTCAEPTTPTDDERAELARRFHARGATRMWIAVVAVAAATL